jgi:hypothetical protein
MDKQQSKPAKVSRAEPMARQTRRSPDAHNLDAKAAAALDEAREIPPGHERAQAMKKAGILRNAAGGKAELGHRQTGALIEAHQACSKSLQTEND